MKLFVTCSAEPTAREIKENYSIGRRLGDWLFEKDDLLSGTHLRFYTENGKPFVEDLGSSNGTLVNGNKLASQAPHELRNGDEVKAGNQVFKVGVELEVEEHTKIESVSSDLFEHTRIALPTDMSEHTHIEMPPNTLPPLPAASLNMPPPSLKVAEEKPAEPRIFQLPGHQSAVSELIEEVEDEEEALANSKGKKNKKIIKALNIGMALGGLILVFALFLMFGSKKKSEVASEETTEETAQPIKKRTKASVAEAQPVQIAPAVVQATAPSGYESPTPVAAAPVAEPAPAAPAPPAVVEQVYEEPTPAPISKKKTKVVSKKSKTTTAAKKPTDPLKEEALLAKLKAIQVQFKNSKSSRVREALEADAIETAYKHYEQYRQKIEAQWKQARSLASDKKSKMKTLLQNQLGAVSRREKHVADHMNDFMAGKIKTPIPNKI